MPTLRESGVRLGTKKPSGRPFIRGHKKLRGRKKGVPNKVPTEIKQGGKPRESVEASTPTLSHLLKLALSKPDAGG